MKIKQLFFAITLIGLLSACNTIGGAGEDIEAAGEKIEEVAEDAKNRMKN